SRSTDTIRASPSAALASHASPTPQPVPVSPITPAPMPRARIRNSSPCCGRHEFSNPESRANSTAAATLGGRSPHARCAAVPPTLLSKSGSERDQHLADVFAAHQTEERVRCMFEAVNHGLVDDDATVPNRRADLVDERSHPVHVVENDVPTQQQAAGYREAEVRRTGRRLGLVVRADR